MSALVQVSVWTYIPPAVCWEEVGSHLPRDFIPPSGMTDCKGSDAPLHASHHLLTAALPRESCLCLLMGLIWGDTWSRLVCGRGQERHGAMKTFPHTLMAHSHRKQERAFSFFHIAQSRTNRLQNPKAPVKKHFPNALRCSP